MTPPVDQKTWAPATEQDIERVLAEKMRTTEGSVNQTILEMMRDNQGLVKEALAKGIYNKSNRSSNIGVARSNLNASLDRNSTGLSIQKGTVEGNSWWIAIQAKGPTIELTKEEINEAINAVLKLKSTPPPDPTQDALMNFPLLPREETDNTTPEFDKLEKSVIKVTRRSTIQNIEIPNIESASEAQTFLKYITQTFLSDVEISMSKAIKAIQLLSEAIESENTAIIGKFIFRKVRAKCLEILNQVRGDKLSLDQNSPAFRQPFRDEDLIRREAVRAQAETQRVIQEAAQKAAEQADTEKNEMNLTTPIKSIAELRAVVTEIVNTEKRDGINKEKLEDIIRKIEALSFSSSKVEEIRNIHLGRIKNLFSRFNDEGFLNPGDVKLLNIGFQ